MTADSQESESSILLSSTTPAEEYSSIAVDKGSNLEEDTNVSPTSFAQDVVDTFHLAIPIFISRVSYVGVSILLDSRVFICLLFD
jgi:hypothetical protein